MFSSEGDTSNGKCYLGGCPTRLEARLRSGKEVSLFLRTSAPQRMKDGVGEGEQGRGGRAAGSEEENKEEGKEKEENGRFGDVFS